MIIVLSPSLYQLDITHVSQNITVMDIKQRVTSQWIAAPTYNSNAYFSHKLLQLVSLTVLGLCMRKLWDIFQDKAANAEETQIWFSYTQRNTAHHDIISLALCHSMKREEELSVDISVSAEFELLCPDLGHVDSSVLCSVLQHCTPVLCQDPASSLSSLWLRLWHTGAASTGLLWPSHSDNNMMIETPANFKSSHTESWCWSKYLHFHWDSLHQAPATPCCLPNISQESLKLLVCK